MRKLTLLLSLGVLVFPSIACKSTLRREAESRVEAWFNESFAKCGQDHFAKFDNPIASIYVSKYGLSEHKALVQFKNLSHEIVEKPVTDTEKLNGTEWRGNVILKYTQFRYHDGERWSLWSDMMIIFSDKVTKAMNELMERPNSPLVVDLGKSKGEWSGLGYLWRAPKCSELPPP